MRYWGWFAAKVTVAAVFFWALLIQVFRLFPAEKDPRGPLSHGAESLLGTLAVMGVFLLAAGPLYVIIRDQRYRCLTCLRRLRMPVEIGSWSRILELGRPRIEYICPYGHGTLREDELQISGRSIPEWEPNSD